MRPPQSLSRYVGADLKASADDACLVKLGTMKAWMARVIQLIPVASRGIAARRSLDGDVWTFDPNSTDHGLSVNANGTVTPSTIAGVVPTIAGDPINGAYTPLVIGSGTVHVVALITGTFAVSTLDSRDFVSPVMTGVAVAIVTTGTLPTGDDLVNTTGDFVLLLATFVDGVKTLQNGHGPMGALLQDALDGSGTAQLIVTPAAP